MAASLGVLLWHGGYRAPAQWLLAAVAAAAIAIVRPLPRAGALREPLTAALALTAVSNLASLAWHHGEYSASTALAAVAVAAIAVVAAHAVQAAPRTLNAVVLAVAVTCATAGLAGLLLHARPLAERIDGLWRAGGTLEYPPALGLLAVCGLASAFALRADGVLDRVAAIVACAVLAAAVLGSFDRVAVLELAAVLLLFAVRVPGSRPVVAATAVVAVLAAVAAIAIADPGRGSLERHLRHGPLTSRRTAWRASWDMARHRPWLGYGPGAHAQPTGNRIVLEPATPAEAHDAPLGQWLAAGVVAAAGTALALAAMLLRGLLGLASAAPSRVAAGVAATAVAASGLYDFTWSFAPLLVLGALTALACREPSG